MLEKGMSYNISLAGRKSPEVKVAELKANS
jgi:hypothetical protein